MHAIRQHAFGGPETLSYEEVPDLEPGEGQVRIAVDAAGVHLIDTTIRSGQTGGPYPVPDLPMTPGREVAGRVDRVGPGVDAALVGRRVVAHLGQASGGYAEQAARPGDRAARAARRPERRGRGGHDRHRPHRHGHPRGRRPHGQGRRAHHGGGGRARAPPRPGRPCRRRGDGGRRRRARQGAAGARPRRRRRGRLPRAGLARPRAGRARRPRRPPRHRAARRRGRRGGAGGAGPGGPGGPGGHVRLVGRRRPSSCTDGDLYARGHHRQRGRGPPPVAAPRGPARVRGRPPWPRRPRGGSRRWWPPRSRWRTPPPPIRPSRTGRRRARSCSSRSSGVCESAIARSQTPERGQDFM